MFEKERLDSLFKNVRLEIGVNNNIPDELILRYCEKGLCIASEVTYYNVASLPIQFNESIINAIVETIQRKTNEGIKSFNNASGSYNFTFEDIEDSLRKKLKGKKNPLSLIGKY